MVESSVVFGSGGSYTTNFTIRAGSLSGTIGKDHRYVSDVFLCSLFMTTLTSEFHSKKNKLLIERFEKIIERQNL